MKKFVTLLSLLLVTTLFVGCEKFELEDHCPEEEQNSTSYGDPQDYRVNDDSDSEESGAHSKALSAGGDVDLDEGQTSMGSSDGSEGNDDSDDLINDDSDNEDEGGQPRKPSGNDSSGDSNDDGVK